MTLLRHTNSSPLIKREKGGREVLTAPFVFVLWYSWSQTVLSNYVTCFAVASRSLRLGEESSDIFTFIVAQNVLSFGENISWCREVVGTA